MNFEDILREVTKFRRAVGFKDQPDNVHYQLFGSETYELLGSHSEEDAADAFGDMLVVMAGHKLDGSLPVHFNSAYIELGRQADLNDINLNEAFKIVMVSNWTKLCSEKHIEVTVEKYAREGVLLDWTVTNGKWACFSAHDYPDKPKGKLLKAVTFQEPDWSGDSWRII